MKRFVSTTIIIAAIVLIAIFVWKPLAGFPIPTLVTQETTQESAMPTPERQPPAKCLDGTPLTVTSRDSNQTDYRCGSGAIGAYTN